MLRSVLQGTAKLNLYVIAGGIAVIMVCPFYWMAITTVSPAPDIIAFPPRWIPSQITLEHFLVAFAKAPWLVYYWNSFAVAVVSVGCSLRLRPLCRVCILRLSLSPADLLLSPDPRDTDGTRPGHFGCALRAPVKDRLGEYLYGNPRPNFASAFGVFMIRQAIKSIPAEMIEAARIDGAGEMRIVLTIIAPLLKTTLATVGMILFLECWNDFLWPVIVINSPGMRTIPVGLALFKDPYGNINYGPLMAATVISTGPMLVAYIISQKYMIRGIAMTGMKG